MRSFSADAIGSNANNAEKHYHQQEQEPKFDLFFWLSDNGTSNEPADETPAEKDDRLFWERMEELEREIMTPE